MLTQPVCEEGIPPDPISRVQSQRRSLYQNVKAFRVCAIKNAITAATNGLRTHTKLPMSAGDQAAALSSLSGSGEECRPHPLCMRPRMPTDGVRKPLACFGSASAIRSSATLCQNPHESVT